jgi:hypothetical protein
MSDDIGSHPPTVPTTSKSNSPCERALFTRKVIATFFIPFLPNLQSGVSSSLIRSDQGLTGLRQKLRQKWLQTNTEKDF